MATITKPMALDESFNTTESTSRNQADVLVGIEQAIVRGFGQVANAVSYDNTDSGLTADNVQDAIDEVDDTVDGLVNDVTEISSDIESTQTATGNPLTLTDCAPINAESLVVELEPKQDLHGYDYPWVGGAGKNKLHVTASTSEIDHVKFTVGSDGSINIKRTDTDPDNATFTMASGVVIPLAMKFNCGVVPDWNGTGFVIFAENGGQNYEISSIDGVELPSGTYDFKIMVQTGKDPNVTIYPMIRLSTESDSTFAPYSNICPITGYTECEVDDVGKNKIDVSDIPSFLEGFIFQNKTLKAGTYTLSFDVGGTLSQNDRQFNIIADETTLNTGTLTTGRNHITFVLPNDTTTLKSYCNASGIAITNIMLEEGSIATSFEPYRTSNATIQFGQTVYGGSVDFKTGVLTVDKGFDTFDGSSDENWIWYGIGSASSYACYIEISPNANVSVRPKSNYATGLIQTDTYGNYDCFVVASSANILIAGKRDKTSVADWKAFLASNPLQVCYELATPFTIQLTPDELKLLKGTNNLSTNGTTITLGYQPDNVIGEIKGEIEKCAVDAEFMQFTDGTDTFTDVNLSLDASLHTVSVVGAKIEQKRFMCFEVMDKMGGVLQGILASCIAFTDGAKTPSGTAFRAYIESLQMYVNFRIYGSGGSYTLAYQSETSFSASAFYVRVRMMNNL